jgi:branched-chain amino acid transport system permease protein
MRSWLFLIVALIVAAATFVLALSMRGSYGDYLLFAGYVVLQYVVLATAWNILGGYCGYVNFGSAAFFAIGAYTTVALHKLGANPGRYLSDTPFEFLGALLPLSLPALILLGGMVSGLVGFGMGYLTLRLRGVFFAIATLAMAVVLQTIVVNWDFVGGSRGAYIIRPDAAEMGPVPLAYIQYLFLVMLLLAVLALWVARTIERSRMGLGFATIRDDETAAEASGVPTLRLKLAATALSGALMGMAGAPFPYYVGYVEPATAFGLPYAVNAIAMPMIGGTTSWAGPLVGALLLGSLQQIATVTFRSEASLLIVGVLLVAFVIAAPVGIVGLMQEFVRAAAPDRLNFRAVAVILIASYCFIAGILGIIFDLTVLQTAFQLPLHQIVNSSAFWIGVFGILVSALYLVSAYGLLKLQRWAPQLASLSLLVSMVGSAVLIGLEPDPRRLGVRIVMIVISLAAIMCLRKREIGKLYNSQRGAQPSGQPVTA